MCVKNTHGFWRRIHRRRWRCPGLWGIGHHADVKSAYAGVNIGINGVSARILHKLPPGRLIERNGRIEQVLTVEPELGAEPEYGNVSLVA